MGQDVATWNQNIKQSAGKKAIRDLSGSGLIEGLGIQQIKLEQNIFRIKLLWYSRNQATFRSLYLDESTANIPSILQGKNGNYIKLFYNSK